MEETDVVMAEVEQVSQQYLPLSSACPSIYFTLEGLNQVCLCFLVELINTCAVANGTKIKYGYIHYRIVLVVLMYIWLSVCIRYSIWGYASRGKESVLLLSQATLVYVL